MLPRRYVQHLGSCDWEDVCERGGPADRIRRLQNLQRIFSAALLPMFHRSSPCDLGLAAFNGKEV